MCRDCGSAVERRGVGGPRRGRVRLEQGRVERVNRQVGDTRHVQECLARLPDLRETPEGGRETGQTAADVEQHLATARHFTNGVRDARDRLQLADIAGTNSALPILILIGESRERTMDRFREQPLSVVKF
jgi:hypothetical protein